MAAVPPVEPAVISRAGANATGDDDETGCSGFLSPLLNENCSPDTR